MNIIVVDDEPLVLADIGTVLKTTVPGAECRLFSLPSQAISYAGGNQIDVAFLDIELGTMNGLVLAKKLKDLQPDLHIIFVTSHEKYALEAFSVHATGYLMKPVMPADITREMTFLYGEAADQKKTVCIQTFGGFSVLVNGKPVNFTRTKSKELLACLVDRRGADITTRAACAILWEDGRYDRARKNYFQIISLNLRSALKQAGIEDILIRKYNSLAIDPSRFDCDSYRFLDGDPKAVNAYRYNYLPNYSWAEFTVGRLENRSSIY